MMLCLRRTILFQQFNNDDDDNGNDDLLTDPLGGSSLLNYLQIKLHYINYNYKINRGYYTVARRYEFYVRVARTISHE